MADWLAASDGTTLAWRRRTRWGRVLGAGEMALPDDRPQTLCAALASIPRSGSTSSDRLRMVLGSVYIRVAALEWPEHRLDAEETAALLRARWRERQTDIAGWWLGVESRGRMRLSTAIPGELIGGLQDVARAADSRTDACLPATALALARLGTDFDGHVAIDEGPRETLLEIVDGRLAGLASRWRRAALHGAGHTVGSPGGADGASDTRQPDDRDIQGVGRRLGGGPRAWLDWV